MTNHTSKTTLIFAGMLSIGAATCASEPVDYAQHIKPILKSRCYPCHGALKQESGLRLDSGDMLRRGGDSGLVVVSGKPNESSLMARVSASTREQRMPPEGEALSSKQIELLRTWIDNGAGSPEAEEPEADPRSHWAFKPPQRTELAVSPFIPHDNPAARDAVDGRVHPIDAFLDAELSERGLTPRPVASKSVLLRRLYLDLIGLPPTGEELRAFLADDSTSAYTQVVDRLLDDPRHGERWGRHWMDVWRYSDWYGRRDVNDVRNSASQIYRWRDWIVRSINADKGYDRMIQEMLAADEICPEDYEAGVATGFLIRNYYSLNANDWMRSAVEHTGKAFLGLTFNCAHCHDHKYDPIRHDDYFRLRAFFEPIYIRQDRHPGEADPGVFQDYSYSGTRGVQRLGSVRVFDKQADAPTWFYTGGDERNRLTDRGSITAGVPTFLEGAGLQMEPVALPPLAWYPGLRPEIQQTMLADAEAAIDQSQLALTQIESTGTSVSAAAKEALAVAEAAYQLADQQNTTVGLPSALSPGQSLLLDATAGRRIVQNGLRSLRSLESGTILDFQLTIVQDSHVNFQFVRDVVKGLTAGYLAFEKGRIVAYQPGTFTEFEVGKYNFEAGQTRFLVSLELRTTEDRCLLTVRSLSDDQCLAEQIPIALNGWSPIGDNLKAISLDARTGSVAMIDDLRVYLRAVDNTPEMNLVSFDFERPSYTVGEDIAGIDGWSISPFSVAPGTSIVSRISGNTVVENKELRGLAQQVAVAKRAVRASILKTEAALARVAAANAELASLKARIAAENTRYVATSKSDLPRLVQEASRCEREAVIKRADVNRLVSELALLEAQARPADDAMRVSAIETAEKGLATAKTAVEQARAALANESLVETYSTLSSQYPQVSTGRRRALAQWITSRSNPLTARVAVNHIWARHFHSPLVLSSFDFGRNGARPTHPQLLDWLAVEFMDSGWSMKHLHRLIVTSAAYQRVSSAGDAELNLSVDPENRLLWRMNSHRMESEVVRDSLLYCAKRLDLTMGGVELENKDALTTHRRSLYYSVYPESGGKSELGELFDAPDPLDCYRRTSSVMPQQALALTNSELVHQCATSIVQEWQAPHTSVADRSAKEDSEPFIVAMFERVLARQPTASEKVACSEILERQTELAAVSDSSEATRQARESLVRILLNHNDFVTIR